VHDPVDAVFVVASREDLADDQFAGAGGGGGVVAEVGVFEEDAVVFFVDADCVFDCVGLAVPDSGRLVLIVDSSVMKRLTFGQKRHRDTG
jgi:hypothetical protein